jgi:hypothetical protein
MYYEDNEQPLSFVGSSAVLVKDSQFGDNHHDDDALPQPGALDVSSASSSVTVERSTFSGNRGTATSGGAVRVANGAVLSVSNSTFANNTFSDGAPQGALGGAIGYQSDDNVTGLFLTHVTIVPPASFPAGAAGSALGGSGGDSGLTLHVNNSIVLGSCALDAGAMDLARGNIGMDTSCQFADLYNQTGVSSTAVALGTLGDHGGYTPTYVPGPGSVAIDAAEIHYCVDEDQRGYARPLGNGCDVGAIETGDVLFANGFE